MPIFYANEAIEGATTTFLGGSVATATFKTVLKSKLK
jgi:hypothetical protein